MAGDRLHGTNNRGMDRPPPRSPSFEGRFGRMFRKLPPAQTDPALLEEIAGKMRDELGAAGDSNIPAGYTYLGQFIDHDVTFDPTSSLERANDPEALVNFRTPKFDLDSLYGSGPADDPFLYDRTGNGLKLLVGSVEGAPGEFDLPRNVQGRALLGDPRNDENTFVSQLHLAFIHAHNRAVDEVTGRFTNDEETFQAAQKIVRWRYQWVVVHDYLRRLLDKDVYKKLVRKERDGTEEFIRPNYRPRDNAYLPVEFSVAAFRFGHSMVRGGYVVNDIVPRLPIFKPGPAGPLEDFRGFRPLPQSWQIKWGLFFDGLEGEHQVARKIDEKLAGALFTLPGFEPGQDSLALRNLQRGVAFELPSGQSVARALGETPLSDADLDLNGRDAPLWYYILREAAVTNGGNRMGPVGSRIVGEVLLGLLELDPQSYVNAPGWPEFLPQPEPDFTMGDFLNWAVPDQAPTG